MTSEPTKRVQPARLTAFRISGLLLAGLALAPVAQAQDANGVQDFRLPPSTSAPRAAGPIESDHPVATPTRPAPEPTPVPGPVLTLPSPAAAEPVVRPEPMRAAPKPRGELPTAPIAAPSDRASAPAVLTAPTAAPLPDAPLPAAPVEVARPDQSLPWPWIAGAAALLALLGGLLLWRRRAALAPEAEPEVARVSIAPQPSPPAALTPPRKLGQDNPPRPAPTPPQPAPTPLPPVHERRPLEMQLEARHLSRAMVNASLAYRLTLTNCTDVPVGPLHISGDIVSAHASLSAQEQLDPGAVLAAIHEVPSLASGESVLLSGELRLPIASILPIQSGGARVFVPLARFRAETAEGPAATRIFVIGQESGEAQGTLRPFPLDRGPGVDRGLGQRELEVPV